MASATTSPLAKCFPRRLVGNRISFRLNNAVKKSLCDTTAIVDASCDNSSDKKAAARSRN